MSAKTTSPHIRNLAPPEYGQLDEFLYQAIYTPPNEPQPPRSVTDIAELHVYIESFGRAGDIAVCAEEQGTIIGIAWARLIYGYGHIENGIPEIAISVLPKYRGCGIGTSLLVALIERCTAYGYSALSLSVQRANPAIHLYKRLGFREISGDQEESIMMLSL